MPLLSRPLYECYVCHKHKKIEQLRVIDEWFICKDCNEPEYEILPEPEISPTILIIPKILMPSVEIFNQFMDDIIFYKSSVKSSLSDQILTLTTEKTKKSIELNIDAVIQNLADKLNHPVIHESYSHSKIDYDKIFEIFDVYLTKFNKIISVNDVRVQELCHAYHEMMSTQMKLKIEYMEWEKTLINGYIQRKVSEGLDENKKKMTQIQQDYTKKLEDEKVKNNTKIENYNREILRLRSETTTLDSLRTQSKEEIAGIKNERDEAFDKMKTTESQMKEKDIEISKLKLEVGKLNRELVKHKSDSEWVLDPTSTDTKQSFFNPIKKEIIKCPENFLVEYELDKMLENGNVIYKKGDTLFEIPESLIKLIKKPTSEMNGTNGESEKGLSAKEIKRRKKLDEE